MKIITDIFDGEDLARYLEKEARQCKDSQIYDIIFNHFNYEKLVGKCQELVDMYDEIKDGELFDIVRFDDFFRNNEKDE